jgi:nucleoside-diphosphate-sugar epimerase
LGGTRYFGRNLVKKLIEDGYDLTIATRGRAKDPFGNDVKRLIVDRNDKESMAKAFSGQRFALVFDNLCYSPNAALNACAVFDGKAENYIFTSSQAVYEQGTFRREEEFNPGRYPIRYGEREAFAYGEGKRLAESVFFQKAPFSVAAVRFPVVIGEDDYTGRLRSYLETIRHGVPLYIDNPESRISLITDSEAGEFLAWIAGQDFKGPINACCNGAIKIKEIVGICEANTHRRWIPADSRRGEAGAFNGSFDNTLDNGKARMMGFQFRDIREAVEAIIGGF